MITSDAIEDIYPLSPMQQGMLFHSVTAAQAGMYIEQLDCALEGPLNVAAFEQAWQRLIDRHAVLRTSFVWDDLAEPVQVVHPRLTVPLAVHDWRDVSQAEQDARLETLRQTERRQGFDPAVAPLMRLTLVRVGERRHRFHWSYHHVLMDGWCNSLLLQELLAHYAAACQGRSAGLPAVRPYRDYIAWLQTRDPARTEAFWRRKLVGFAAPTPLAVAKSTVSGVSGFATQQRTISSETTARLRELARSRRLTLNTLLQGAYALLLSRYSGEQDVVFGTVVAGRPAELDGIDTMIGLFVNTLPMRVQIDPAQSLVDWLATLQEQHQELREFEHSPLVKVQSYSGLPGGVPLFYTNLIFENYAFSSPATTSVEELSVSQLRTAEQGSYPLSLVAAVGDGLLIEARYYRNWLGDAAVSRLLRHLDTLLSAFADDPTRPVGKYPLVGTDERKELLGRPETGRDGRCKSLRTQALESIVQRFERQALATPDAIAVTCQGAQLTYDELNRQANGLAHALIERGVQPEARVALCVERSPQMIVAILGILKAGGAYVPLDPDAPASRLEHMLSDCGSPLLVTEAALTSRLASRALPVLCLDRDAELLAAQLDNNPKCRSVPGNLAYVIYTSGSTGQPKGSLITHANVVRLFDATDEWFHFAANDVWTLFHSYAFDFSVWEIWGALLYGGRIVVVPYWISRAPDAVRKLLSDERVTIFNQTPSAFKQFQLADEAAASSAPLSLREVVFGGEALDVPGLKSWFDRHGDRAPRLVNMYGITETTVHVTYRPLTAADAVSDAGSVIGVPIPDLELYVLDDQLEPSPIGIPGELFVGGAGLGRGYLNRPELTAERFIPDPFSECPGARLYRSGDLARRLADGDVEYLGRIDHQVKIRGFRIELGEIESAIGRFPGVSDQVVTVRETAVGEKRLVAYLVPSDGVPLSIAELRKFLGSQLPDYMTPAAFVLLDRLPLTQNGKVDRRALPEPKSERPELASEYVEPRTPLEQYLATVWQETLEIERIGVRDSFFDLGGDSIKAVVVVNKLQAQLGEIVHIVALFDGPTVEGLASFLGNEYPDAVRRLYGEESLPDPATRVGRSTLFMDRVDAESLEQMRRLSPLLPPLDASRRPRTRRAVFVLSPPRSGTTLLRVVLGGHPQLFAPPELELLSFNTLRDRKAAFSGRNSFWLEGVLRAVMELKRCSADEAKELMQRFEDQDLSCTEFYGVMNDWLGDRILVDKTPSYALSLSILERAESDFDRPLYLHLLRHPCGMIRSFEEARLDQIFFRGSHNFSRRTLAEMIWAMSHRNIQEFFESIPVERRCAVRFEDLVQQPESTVRRMCDFLGIDFVPDMLQTHAEKKQRMTDGIHEMSRMQGDVKFHQYRGIESSVADRWRSDRDLEAGLGDVTWRLAEQYGYERPSDLATLQPFVEAPLPAVADQPPLLPVPRDRPLELSFAQQRLWFIDQLAPGGTFYNMPLAFEIHGALDVGALERAFNELVRRHEALRTTFANVNGRPMQIIAPVLTLPIVHADLRHLAPAERRSVAERMVLDDARQPFDLGRGPLVRALLVTVDDTSRVILWNMHHIVADGWSLDVLVREVVLLYLAFVRGQPSPLSELPIQYADYAHWQRQWLTGAVLQRQLAYWKERLADVPVLELPTDRPRLKVQTHRGATHHAVWPRALWERVKTLGQQEGCTPYMTLLAAFQTLLMRYSGQDDIVVGSVTANRNRAEIQGLIGFFVNSLVLRTSVAGDPTFREQMARVREVALGAFANQDLPFEQLVEEIQPERDLGREPLFQVVFSMQNAPRASLRAPGLTLDRLGGDPGVAKYDLMVLMGEVEEGLSATFVYTTDLFVAATIERMANQLHSLIETACTDPSLHLSQIALLPADERTLVLEQWPRTAPATNDSRSVTRLFEDRAAQHPDAPAIASRTQSLTYGELNRQANRLARRLCALGVGPETIVGVCLPRTTELYVAFWAILKAGGAYLPLDAAHPADRLQDILNDSRAPLVITTSALRELVNQGAAKLLCLDEEAAHDAALGDANLAIHSSPQSLAYAIYTSGSTGRPKGAMLHHAGFVNFIHALAGACGLTADSRVLAFASVGFDASIMEIAMAVGVGASLVIADEETRLAPERLTALIHEQRVDAALLPPTMLAVLDPAALPGLKSLLSGGEACPIELAERWSAGRRFLNAYGPTEITVCATLSAPLGKDNRRPPIGRPLPGFESYILDARMQPAPTGVPGELYLGGIGLARGYLGRPDLTAERFVPHPFSNTPGARLYRTGDRCRFLSDGTIDYLGRVDEQVKIRGVRIEPAEIEYVLRDQPGVQQAAVVAMDLPTRGPSLVAYVVPKVAALQPADRGAAEAPASGQIDDWRKLYEETYVAIDADAEEGAENFAGWNSSYTGEPIPVVEMQHWADERVARILRSQPRTLLEIGCGNGLLLSRMAARLERYQGLDFSPTAICNSQRIADRCGWRHVSLHQGAADDLAFLNGERFDAVVLNSIVQYFPNIDYLLQVLDRAVPLVQAGGCLFLGDLRSRPLLAAFVADIQLSRAAATTTVSQFLQTVRRRVLQEEELVLSPELFAALRQRYPRLSSAEVDLQRGPLHNELAQYRYDVVLHFDGTNAPAVARQDDDWDGDDWTLERLANRLRELNGRPLRVRGIPNARVSTAVRALELAAHDRRLSTVAELRTALAASSAAVDPEDLWRLGSEAGCSVAVTYSVGGALDRCDAVFASPEGSPIRCELPPIDGPSRPWTDYANNPLREKLLRRLMDEWSQSLRARLPEAMVPAAIVPLERLPLTPSGKLDRRALPAPDLGRSAGGDHVAPRTPLEAQLVQIWEEVLGTAPIGVYDNFFELGGHSMLAVELVARIEKTLDTKVALAELFQEPTVARLADSLTRAPTAEIGNLVPLQRGRSDLPPLFCIHPAGGTVFCYMPLVRRLGSERTVYGIQACGIDGREPPETVLGEMAARYVRELKNVQPRGPYYLAGWSLGGQLAFELAQQLTDAGDEVGLLTLIDAMPQPTDKPPIEEIFGGRTFDNTDVLVMMFGQEFGITRDDVAGLSPDEQVHFFLERLKRWQFVPESITVDQALPLLAVVRANSIAAYQHQAAPYRGRGRVLLLRPEVFPPETVDAERRFCALLGDRVTVCRVPGDHLTMAAEPHVAVMAEQLRSALASATNR